MNVSASPSSWKTRYLTRSPIVRTPKKFGQDRRNHRDEEENNTLAYCVSFVTAGRTPTVTSNTPINTSSHRSVHRSGGSTKPQGRPGYHTRDIAPQACMPITHEAWPRYTTIISYIPGITFVYSQFL